MAQQSQAIHQLLDAEKKAGEIVEAARKRKGRRLKQARTEAAEEIEVCRKDQEREFQRIEREQKGSGSSFQQEVVRDMEKQLSLIQRQVQLNKHACVEQLLSMVTSVEPKLHENLRL